ncbi:APOBEC1 complementation factor-like [Anopheles stephensi]|uniref:Uncharacterized protein n=1 Tax=Anopheles stephensi TaxID=30069 RepID=A0A182XVH1_ANOST|nr:APOBEC1 complementation factor-like [Anopheles stephensi]
MPVTWLDNVYIVHHINGQCVIVLSTKVRELLPELEIYVRGIPRNFGPDELIPVFSRAGLVHSIRLFMDYNQSNRGFAYVSYVNSLDIGNAMLMLNGVQIAVNHTLQLHHCRDPRTFFICNVTNHFTRRKIYQAVSYLIRMRDFQCQLFQAGDGYKVQLTFRSHPDFIRAHTKLNRVRHVFGPNCFLKVNN